MHLRNFKLFLGLITKHHRLESRPTQAPRFHQWGLKFQSISSPVRTTVLLLTRLKSSVGQRRFGALLAPTLALVKAAKMADGDQLKQQADEYYEQMEYAKIVELLEPAKESGDVELLWRLARAMYELHKPLSTDAAKLAHLEQGLTVVQRAMSVDERHPNCHKWMAIFLNAISKLQGSRAQIEQGPVIKEHMLKACELAPSDPTNWHLLGMWAFTVADISWTMRNLAKMIFGEPPKASFQEALDYFLKADEAKPGSYSMTLLMIGKSHHKLKDNENAIVYLKRTRDYPVKTTDDEQAHKEALDLLKNLGVKE